jgi:hypothetical protein
MIDDEQTPGPIACRGPTLLVCEHSGDWARRLRRLLDAARGEGPATTDGPALTGVPTTTGGAATINAPGTERGDGKRAVRIIETRSAAECLEALGRAPAAVVALELTAGNREAMLNLLVALDARFPHARTAVLAARSMRGYRWLLHELGAVCVICSPWRLATLVDMVSRQVAAQPCRTDLALDQVEEIWESLPWQ